MRREGSNSLKQLTARRSHDVDHPYVAMMTKKFGVRDSQPVPCHARYIGDNCYRSRIGMQVKRKIDRLANANRYGHAGYTRPYLPSFQLPAADTLEDNRYTGKHLVPVLHREQKLFGITCDHDVKLYPSIGLSERLCLA